MVHLVGYYCLNWDLSLKKNLDALCGVDSCVMVTQRMVTFVSFFFHFFELNSYYGWGY
jgi:hypothetical protein